MAAAFSRLAQFGACYLTFARRCGSKVAAFFFNRFWTFGFWYFVLQLLAIASPPPTHPLSRARGVGPDEGATAEMFCPLYINQALPPQWNAVVSNFPFAFFLLFFLSAFVAVACFASGSGLLFCGPTQPQRWRAGGGALEAGAAVAKQRGGRPFLRRRAYPFAGWSRCLPHERVDKC